MSSAPDLRVIPTQSVANRKRLPRIADPQDKPGLRAVTWHAVARTADDRTIVVTVHVSAEPVTGIAGVSVTETPESVRLNVFGHPETSDTPHTLTSVHEDFLIDLDQPLAGRRLLGTD